MHRRVIVSLMRATSHGECAELRIIDSAASAVTQKDSLRKTERR